MAEGDKKMKVGGGLTIGERSNQSNTRNLGPEGNGSSPLKKSIENAPIITKDKRNTGRVG